MLMEGEMVVVVALQAHCARTTPTAAKGTARHNKNFFLIHIS